MHSDRINVGYILTLLQLVLNTDDEQKRKQYEAQIHDLIGSEVGLHDKQELIKKFIEDNMPKMINGQSVQDAFAEFWDAEKEQAYQRLCEEENLKSEQMKVVLDNYEFTKRLPRKEELKELPTYKVRLFERDNVFTNLLVKTRQLIGKFFTVGIEGNNCRLRHRNRRGFRRSCNFSKKLENHFKAFDLTFFLHQ